MKGFVLVLGFLALAAQPALAHGANTKTSATTGMLSWNALTQLLMPDDDSDWIGLGQVRVKSENGHHVSIVDPMGGNSVVNNVNYDLYVQVNGVTAGTPTAGRNVQANIINGIWQRPGTDDWWVSVSYGSNQTASAHAQLWGHNRVPDTGPSAHGHSFNALP